MLVTELLMFVFHYRKKKSEVTCPIAVVAQGLITLQTCYFQFDAATTRRQKRTKHHKTTLEGHGM